MKTILITGANRGIGLGLTKYYLDAGWKVIGTARRGRGAEAFQPLEQVHGECFVAVELDVSNEDSIRLLKGALSGHTLDLVINNAGTCFDENLGQWTAAIFADSFMVNAIGPALVAQMVVPQMAVGAKLVNITSGMGSLELNINPDNGLDAYAMSKTALNMLSRRLAAKLESRKILVVSLGPGWVQTDMGGAEAPTTVDDAVVNMVHLISRVTQAQSGKCISVGGGCIPW